MRKVVYTCITGNYDVLRDIRREPGFDYVCFTNNRLLRSSSWDVVYIDEPLDNRVLQRKVKILGYQYLSDYDLLIYVDANISLRNGLQAFLDRECDLERYDMVSFRHRYRDCIYEEINACISEYKETLEAGQHIEAFLRSEHYPEHNGLTENTVIVRKNTSEVNALMDAWFDMILRFSSRDQLSFNYCLWKHPVRIQILNMNVLDNYYFRSLRHQKLDLLPYRLVYGPRIDKGYRQEYYDFHSASDGIAIIQNGTVRIEHQCHQNTSVIRLFFFTEAGINIQRAAIRADAPDSTFKVRFVNFQTIGKNHYTLGDSFSNSNIEFSGVFTAGESFSIVLDLIPNLQTALVGQIKAQSSLTRYKTSRIESSVSYRLGRAITFLPRKVRDIVRMSKRSLRRDSGLVPPKGLIEGYRSFLFQTNVASGKQTTIVYFDLHKEPCFKPYFEASGAEHISHYKNREAALIGNSPRSHQFPAFLLYERSHQSVPPDRIIVFDTMATPRQLNWLCDLYPSSRIILWFWNPARKSLLDGRVSPRVEMWTYSESDSIQYGLHLNTQFFFDCLVPVSLRPDYRGNASPSVLFVGREKNRTDKLNTIKQELEIAGAKVSLSVFPFPGKERNNWFYEDSVPYGEILRKVQNTDILLDVSNNTRAGLSLRPLEALFFEKKLITNNKTVIDTDFYHPNNIYVYGLDTRSLQEFFACEYHPLPKELKDRYLFSNWLKRFDESNNSLLF